MTTYELRLRFRLPQKSFIAENAESAFIHLPGHGRQIVLQSPSANKLVDSKTIDMLSGNYLSADAAMFDGREIRDTLTICCALLRMGIEIGKHEETLELSEVLGISDGRSFVMPRSLNGLLVYPQGASIEHTEVTTSVSGGPPTEKFQGAFVASWEMRGNLSSRLRLAFELYNSHYFQASETSRFLQLVSVVECLCERRLLDDLLVAHVDHIVSLSKHHLATLTEISSDQRDSFVQRIQELKRESISSACRNLITEHVGKAAAETFRQCYNTRSKITHEGQTPSSVDLSDQYSKLDHIVVDLLYAMVSGQRAHP